MRLLITGGPTREFLDRLRFLSNPATGVLGDALAREARARGHEVTLVRGPSPGTPPEDVKTVHVESTDDMRRACLEAWPHVDAVIMAANPCDYKPSERHPGKLKRIAVGEKVILSLVRTPDILLDLSRTRRPGQKVIGFAVDVDEPERNALDKLDRKGLDLVVLNPPENFGRDSGSLATIYGRAGRLAELRGSKRDLAVGVLEAVERL